MAQSVRRRKETVKGIEKEIPQTLKENERKCQGNEKKRKKVSRKRERLS